MPAYDWSDSPSHDHYDTRRVQHYRGLPLVKMRLHFDSVEDSFMIAFRSSSPLFQPGRGAWTMAFCTAPGSQRALGHRAVSIGARRSSTAFREGCGFGRDTWKADPRGFRHLTLAFKSNFRSAGARVIAS